MRFRLYLVCQKFDLYVGKLTNGVGKLVVD